jgi:hypothetical protein
VFKRCNIVSEADLINAVARRDKYLASRPTGRTVVRCRADGKDQGTKVATPPRRMQGGVFMAPED